MESYLQIESLTKSVGDRILFADVTFGINEGDKIGLVAKNGTGKTTLLRCIAGIDDYDSGRIVFRNGLRVAMLEQTPVLDPERTVLEVCVSDDVTEVSRAVTAYEEAMTTGDAARIAEASHVMDSVGAWDYEDRLRQLLTQLHISDLTQRVATLSGGQRKRVALARLIIDRPDLIILDEPTNHLDIETIEWLEGWLTRQRVTLLMVTHDRYFLDRVCNRIIEIDMATLYSYDGNYDYYLRRRAERIEAMGNELDKIRNTLRRETEWMRRQPQARAGKAKYRIDAYYDLKERSRLNLTERNVNLDVRSGYIGSKIFEARHVSKRFGDKVILDDFSYDFARGEKVGIIGPNGIGKSTFVKMLQGLEPIDSGSWELGTTVRFGYYSQDGIQFNPGKRVVDAITEIAEEIAVDDSGTGYSPMQFLQRFLFTPKDQQKYISTLSGGERARLHLASVLMRRPNFLILDEPTNDLDIVTLGILEEYLREFKGCVIIISHDRFFLDNIADHLFVFEGDGVIKDFAGTYSEYAEWKRRREAEARDARAETAAAADRQPRNERREHTVNRAAKMSYKERKEFEELTAELEALNTERATLEALFASPDADAAAIDTASQRYSELKDIIDEKEMRWLELSEKE